MAIVNISNQYNTLRECILGDVDVRLIDSINPSPAWRKKLEHIFARTSSDFNKIQAVLEDRGIVVHRPKLTSVGNFTTPFCNIQGGKIPLAPRDFFLISGNTIIETVNWQPEAMFMTYNYRDTMLDYFNGGSNWISMPLPRHDSTVVEGEDIPNLDPIFDAPSAVLHNDDMFISTHGANNKLGEQWIRRTFAHKNIIAMPAEHFSGHLDSHFSILRDKLMMSFHPREHFPSYFDDWEMIGIDAAVDKERSASQTFVDGRLQDDDFDNTVLAVNMLSLDPNTVLACSHYKDNHIMVDGLQQHGIEVVFVDFEYLHFFNNGITCILLDTVRDD